MPPKSDYVARLLQAEQNRNATIAEARQRKQQRLKQAKQDAEKAVGDYKREKEEDLSKFEATLSTDSEGKKMKLLNETESQIEEVRKVSGERFTDVVKLVTDMICTVSK